MGSTLPMGICAILGKENPPDLPGCQHWYKEPDRVFAEALLKTMGSPTGLESLSSLASAAIIPIEAAIMVTGCHQNTPLISRKDLSLAYSPVTLLLPEVWRHALQCIPQETPRCLTRWLQAPLLLLARPDSLAWPASTVAPPIYVFLQEKPIQWTRWLSPPTLRLARQDSLGWAMSKQHRSPHSQNTERSEIPVTMGQKGSEACLTPQGQFRKDVTCLPVTASAWGSPIAWNT